MLPALLLLTAASAEAPAQAPLVDVRVRAPDRFRRPLVRVEVGRPAFRAPDPPPVFFAPAAPVFLVPRVRYELVSPPPVFFVPAPVVGELIEGPGGVRLFLPGGGHGGYLGPAAPPASAWGKGTQGTQRTQGTAVPYVPSVPLVPFSSPAPRCPT